MSDKIKEAVLESRLVELLSEKDKKDLLKKAAIICSVIVLLAAACFAIVKLVNRDDQFEDDFEDDFEDEFFDDDDDF